MTEETIPVNSGRPVCQYCKDSGYIQGMSHERWECGECGYWDRATLQTGPSITITLPAPVDMTIPPSLVVAAGSSVSFNPRDGSSITQEPGKAPRWHPPQMPGPTVPFDFSAGPGEPEELPEDETPTAPLDLPPAAVLRDAIAAHARDMATCFANLDYATGTSHANAIGILQVELASILRDSR